MIDLVTYQIRKKSALGSWYLALIIIFKELEQ